MVMGENRVPRTPWFGKGTLNTYNLRSLLGGITFEFVDQIGHKKDQLSPEFVDVWPLLAFLNGLLNAIWCQFLDTKTPNKSQKVF